VIEYNHIPIYRMASFSLSKYVNIYVFVISFAVGMFVVYTTMNSERKIYVYPTPENVDLIQYRDKTNACFQFKQSEVNCPTNAALISQIPAQV
jgi:hypothetical protein